MKGRKRTRPNLATQLVKAIIKHGDMLIELSRRLDRLEKATDQSEEDRRLAAWGNCTECGRGAIGFLQGRGPHCDRPKCDPIDWGRGRKKRA